MHAKARTIAWILLGGACTCVCLWRLSGGRPAHATTDGHAPWLEADHRVAAFYSALEAGRLQEAQREGDALVGDPEALLALVDRVLSGLAPPDRLERWAGIMDIAMASYLRAPERSGTTALQRERFLRSSLDVPFHLPPEAAGELLGRRLHHGGFRPPDAAVLIEYMSLSSCFDVAARALEGFVERGEFAPDAQDLDRLRRVVGGLSMEGDAARASTALAFVLSRGSARDLELLESAFQAAGDPLSRGQVLRAALAYPDAATGWERVSALAEGCVEGFDGFAVSPLPYAVPEPWRHLARDRLLDPLGARSRRMLLDLAWPDDELLGFVVQTEADPGLVAKAIGLLASAPESESALHAALSTRVCLVGPDGNANVSIEVADAAISALERILIPPTGGSPREATGMREVLTCLVGRFAALEPDPRLGARLALLQRTAGELAIQDPMRDQRKEGSNEVHR